MEYRWIDDINEFVNISTEWDSAIIASNNYNVFLLSDFIVTWWKHYFVGRTLSIFVVSNNGRIVGGIPLYIQKGGFSNGFARILVYIGDVAANYTEPLVLTDDIQFLHILTKALVKRKDWDILYLKDVTSGSKLLLECNNLTFDGRLSVYTLQEHMNYSIDLSCGKEKYFSTLSKRLKQDLRSKRRYATKNYGVVSLKTIKGKEEVKCFFDIYSNFSIGAFGNRNVKSNFENAEYHTFLKEFFVLIEEKGRLYSYALLVGDKVVAVSFAYRFGKGFNWVLNAFDYKYKNIRPGYLITEELINELLSLGETYFNLYGHESFFKNQWCNQDDKISQLFIINNTFSGQCYRTLQFVERTLKTHKIVRDLIRSIRKMRYAVKAKFQKK